MSVHDGSRFRGMIVIIVTAMMVPVMGATSAFAVGDANEAACSAATESSPGFRSSLPDCRAYEIVNEANSGDTSNVTGSFGFPEGEHVYYKSFLPTPGVGARDGVPERFLATRTSSGWQDKAISLPQGEALANLSLAAQENAEGVGFSTDFRTAFVRAPFQDPFEDPRLNETVGMGAYSLSLATGAETTLSLPDSGKLTQPMIETPAAYQELAKVNDWGEFLSGVSGDGGRAFFETTAQLTTAPGTPVDTHEASNEVYERTNGHTYLVGVLPNGEAPNCGAEVGQGGGTTVETQTYWSYGAIAPNGANVVFKSPAANPISAVNPCNESGLYLRDVVHGTTVKLSGLFFGGRAGTGAGEEEKIFSLEPGTGEIFEYHVGTELSTEIGVGRLLAYSRDGSRVYFVGEEEGIYVYEAGQTRLIPGTQEGGYFAGGSRNGGAINNRAPTEDPEGQTRNMPVASAGSSDGSHLLFIDSSKLTGYENESHKEAYIYNVATNTVRCISCNLHNEPPQVPRQREKNAQLIDDFSTDAGEGLYQTPSPPFISADGSRAVFETTEDLLPQDTNGTMDVYEWVLAGMNGCTTESSSYSQVIEGCVFLLSSGLGKEGPFPAAGQTDGTHLVGASEELRDVYMQTPEALLPGVDNAMHLYDVHANGGFPYIPPVAGGCEPGQCKSGGEAGVFSEPESEAFSGPENMKPMMQHGHAGSRSKRGLARALRACRRKHGKRRRRCEARARARFAGSGGSVVRLNGGSK